ncbi:beta-glucuronidase [Halanaerobium saccharolyticum]|uniref:Beta-glucuronidase n=1 Tax=Halanaerobium saccharolyticum TaxID=43595 RepID=A0A2T5RN19_9FIRM|nr:beta-glucuronidase [Halanaerobium saccharolyticum]PTW00909.1 beta-glucuronidase [Halanaerobium saccharolyticum]
MESQFLYPAESPTRQVVDLSGIWKFKVDFDGKGREEGWQNGLTDFSEVPVPSSYNDLFTDKDIREHVGDVWYQTEFYLAEEWQQKNVNLRFGSATHRAEVWLNGEKIAEHEGGYMPFGAVINEAADFGAKNTLVVVVNNELDLTTIPTGQVKEYDDGKKRLFPYFDFFNYAGIHSAVKLQILPKDYIYDITTVTDFEGETGFVEYEIESSSHSEIKVELKDLDGKVVAQNSGTEGKLEVENVKLWQPGEGYLYNLEVSLLSAGELVDNYPLPVGIRRVEVKGNRFLINDEPFYFKGFGKHQDSEINGRGFDPAVMIRDAELLDWIGANSVRTSHYPYDEEFYRMCDRRGVVVIDETPAVGLFDMNMNFLAAGTGEESDFFDKEIVHEQTKENHKREIRRLMKRDKNHASVVMWCLANEPDSAQERAEEYFEEIFSYARDLDPQARPLTFTNLMTAQYGKCNAAQFADVISLNRYYGWYLMGGAELRYSQKNFEEELAGWEKEGKPIVMTEYGADTKAGIHKLPSVQWSEEYQNEYLELQHKVFDNCDSIVGEQMWNFADFQTVEGILRVDGNKKGAFTRDRQPKMAAHLLKQRWEKLPNDYKG